MKREQFIREFADRLGLPEHSAQVFLHAFFDSAKMALRTGDPLRIEGLGNWIPSLHADGTLKSLQFTPATVNHTAVTIQRPSSSIDSMHFIPVDAL
ncbi:MAG: HU family DNA-binding protein, partial [Bacteroidota bacterium]|nr:HU family DNA-binding protein [Bacteroidota bacterium]